MSDVKRLPVMEDYLLLHRAGDPCMHNGLLAWTDSCWDTEKPVGRRFFREQVYIARVENSHLTDRQTVTAGGSIENCPVIARDGAVWFLSDASLNSERPEQGAVPEYIVNELFSQMQLYRWQAGCAQQMTHMRHGVEKFFLSPDQQRAFFLAWKYESDSDADMTREYTEKERAETLEKRLDTPFSTENQRYKADAETGYRSVRRQTLWLWENGETRCLLSDKVSFAAPCWLPDGQRILYQYTNGDGRLTFAAVDVQSGETRDLATVINAAMCFETDGAPLIDEKNEQIIFAANTPGMEYADPRRLFAIPLTGGENLSARRLLAPEKDVDGVFPQDMNFWSCNHVRSDFVLCGGYVYYATAHRGDVCIARVPALAEDAAPEIVTKPMQSFHALSAVDDEHLLLLCGLPTRLPEAAMVSVHTGDVTVLTHSNPWLDGVLLHTPASVWTKSGTHGFYLPPAGEKKNAPGILFCHGGPTGFFSSALNYELHALAAAGFGVMYANPRGGTGYGADRSKDEFAYDGTALSDLIEFVDTVCDLHPELDKDNVGICGGSYGGFMTLHAAIRCDRFRAASAHRPLAHMLLIGTSSHSAGGHTRETSPEYLQHILQAVAESPAVQVDKIRIPLQILQSANDANCVPEQMNQVYTAMRAWNPSVPCEYILFPDSGHGLNHKGPMELSVAHRNACLRWMQKWLQKEEQA